MLRAFFQGKNTRILHKERRTLKDLMTKVETLDKTISKLDMSEVRNLPTFLAIVETTIKSIEKEEWQKAPLSLISLRDNTVRGNSSCDCYTTYDGEVITPSNTFCHPYKKPREVGVPKTVVAILEMSDKEKKLRASYSASAQHFMKHNHALIKKALKDAGCK